MEMAIAVDEGAGLGESQAGLMRTVLDGCWTGAGTVLMRGTKEIAKGLEGPGAQYLRAAKNRPASVLACIRSPARQRQSHQTRQKEARPSIVSASLFLR